MVKNRDDELNFIPLSVKPLMQLSLHRNVSSNKTCITSFSTFQRRSALGEKKIARDATQLFQLRPRPGAGTTNTLEALARAQWARVEES